MKKIIIVSNRLPVELKIENDKITFKQSVGGLTTGLSSVHPKDHNLWVGWLGIPEQEIPGSSLKDDLMDEVIRKDYIPIFLTEEEIDSYYYGYSNDIIWPLFHYFPEYAKFNSYYWSGYKKVNEKFAREILNYTGENDTVWVHDYHLMLLPAMLKTQQSHLNIGFFLHIPFPTYEVFRMLPSRVEILKGLLGTNLIGFHTSEYQQYFIESVSRLLPCEIHGNEIIYEGHKTVVEVFPMGIDADEFENEAHLQKEQEIKPQSIKAEIKEYTKHSPQVRFIISIDRLDYSKGIVNRLEAFDYFLENNPHYKEQVKLLMLAVPSRTCVPQYQLLKKDIDELVGRINSKHATVRWTPILYLFRSLPFEDLISLYTCSDVALITPVRDGMNLVAKEYVMSRSDQDGVLILSEMAGASKELKEALIINPMNYREISNALLQALEMPKEDQAKRIKIMQDTIRNNNVKKWATNFLTQLEGIPSNNLQQESALKNRKSIIEHYEKAEKRLILLDYDGTLVGFQDNPEMLAPDKELTKLIRTLAGNSKNDLYLISGRKKENLEAWFADLPIGLIAEHGSFIRQSNKDWKSEFYGKSHWKKKIQKLLESYTEKIPDSFIEEKTHALAWHYRKVPGEIGVRGAREIVQMLRTRTMDLGIQVLNGNKVIEVTAASINKGNAVRNLMRQKDYDFILAIGDDTTDEFMFRQLPSQAISIKVGTAESAAKYRLKDFKQVRFFLYALSEKETIVKRIFDIGNENKKQII